MCNQSTGRDGCAGAIHGCRIRREETPPKAPKPESGHLVSHKPTHLVPYPSYLPRRIPGRFFGVKSVTTRSSVPAIGQAPAAGVFRRKYLSRLRYFPPGCCQRRRVRGKRFPAAPVTSTFSDQAPALLGTNHLETFDGEQFSPPRCAARTDIAPPRTPSKPGAYWV